MFPWKPLISYCKKNPKKWYVKQMPNFITVTRLILIWPLSNLLIKSLTEGSVTIIICTIALGCLIGSGDAADGEISGRIGYSTVFGEMTDPVADKAFFLVLGARLLLFITKRRDLLTKISLVLGIILALTEFVLVLIGVVGFFISRYREIKLGSNNFGQLKFPTECFWLLGVSIMTAIWQIANINIYPIIHIFTILMFCIATVFASFSIFEHLKSLKSQPAD